MLIANNQTQIEKCIISFSHNKYDSRKSADNLSIAKAKSEIKAGKNGVSHLILRSRDDEIDRLKFLFLIHGIPVMCYSLGNLLCSSLKEIVVIGSDEVQRILNCFLDIVGTNGKKIQFIKEDDERLNLANTLNLARSKLSISNNELILFQPGDLPFLYDLEKVLSFEGNKESNIVLWLNSRQKMFPELIKKPASEFIKRNYHYRILNRDDSDLHDLKEPNLYPLNFAQMESEIVDYLHSFRKDGQIIHAGIKMALNNPARMIRALPYLVNHIITFRKRIHKLRPGDKYQFGMSRKNFEKSVSNLLNIPVTANLHEDVAFVSDVDALEDWEDFESLTYFASNQGDKRGLKAIHPFGEELLKFREVGMPLLKNEISMYQNFPAYLNKIYQTLEMGYVPFDAMGNYVSFKTDDSHELEYAYIWYQRKCKAMSQKNSKNNESL